MVMGHPSSQEGLAPSAPHPQLCLTRSLGSAMLPSMILASL